MTIRIARTPVGLIALLAFAAISGAYGQPGDSDWQEYGWSKLGKLDVFLFFDAAGVVRRDNGHVEVWTKVLSRKDLDRAISTDSIGKRVFFKFAEKKVAQNYHPPISTVRALGSLQLAQVLVDEAAANVGNIEAASRILYELDCTNRLLREISIRLLVNGETRSKDTPREWRHVSPETVAADLFKLGCTQH